MLIRCVPVQVNAAFDGHVDDCDVVGFMHALGYSAFKAEGEALWSNCHAWCCLRHKDAIMMAMCQ